MGSRLGCVQRGTGAAAPSPLCNPPYPARRTDTKRLQSTSTQAIILSTAAIPASPLQAHLSIGKEGLRSVTGYIRNRHAHAAPMETASAPANIPPSGMMFHVMP